MTTRDSDTLTAVPVSTAPDLTAHLDDLLARLDLPAKVALLSGSGAFRTPAEPAVGLRAISVSDGPAGVRGERWDERDTALALPSPTALAASWDEQLVTELGGLLAAEARRKQIDVLLAPTLNLHRSPFAGRHFECFSEDPLLTARTGAAYIRGVQAGGVAATAKHYVANESETERLTLDARVDERTLHEVYLAPFEEAVRAGAWLVMSAYNQVNGTTMSESPLLAEPLKGSWGFDGVVVSDWGAVRSTDAAANAEQDLAMPGPHPLWGEPLVAAVREGRVPEAAVDAKVRRILLLAARVGALESVPGPAAPPAPADPAGLLRRAVAAGSVLLRNEGGLLPLDPGRLRRVAVLGQGAAQARIQGGGSAGVFPATVVSPLDGIRAALDGRAEVVHAAGPLLSVRPTPLHAGNARNPETGEPGVLVRYLDADGRELHREHRLSGRVLEPAAGPAALGAATGVELSALLRPDSSGDWDLSVVGLGAVSLEVDGHTLLDTYVTPRSDDPTYLHVSPSFSSVRLAVTEGRPLRLVARRRFEPGTGQVVALAADPPRPAADEAIALAAEAARGADAAVVVVGTNDEIESEGFDRGSLALPGRQDDLVRAVVAANPRTVVLVNSGGPVELPWREQVPAVLLGWFPGQEAGHGLADVLFGHAEPGGRLPTTWAAAADGAPLPGVLPDDGVLRYDEGADFGYRAWLRSGAEPAYWFGHGLGYTSWEYEELTAPGEIDPAAGAEIRVRLRNTGDRPGREVVQLYLDAGDGLRLAGYAAVTAGAGERAEAVLRPGPRSFQQWSPQAGAFVYRPGRYTLHAGSSAGRLLLSASSAVG
ncbi:glycoside hydrolase family 3 C-terminal domain-containing protein [Streptomyces sp. NPDC092296]|uniref:glycoside hydrolase family 3 C-terminal domain-containing protein n=1 Tax=Streptomyces sp. NPDC092296 TaxID=3366012 RepID=UPI003807D106